MKYIARFESEVDIEADSEEEARKIAAEEFIFQLEKYPSIFIEKAVN
jgi:hypothetical protein